MTDLGTFGGTYSYAYGISADGNVVVGYAYTSGNAAQRAFRWKNGSMTDLGTLGGTYSRAYGVSADGSVVVGQASKSGDNVFRAYRWENNAMTDLGTLGGTHSWAYGVSADGSVVVGMASRVRNADAHAYRWENNTMIDLGTLGGTYSQAWGVSADGSVVVGEADTCGDAAWRAFRWKNNTMTDLGTLGGTYSRAYGVSADGSVVVGQAHTSENAAQRAFRWNQANGMQSVEDWLRAAGISVTMDITYTAYAINADGSVVVGQLENGHAFIARVSTIGAGIIDPVLYTQSVAGAGQTYHSGEYLASLMLNGAHHRPLTSYALPGGKCMWATGDLGDYGNGRDARSGLGEIGVCGDFAGGALRAGLGVGHGRFDQDTALGGQNDVSGQYAVGEIDWRVPDTALLVSATARHGRYDADIRRGYDNGGAIDHSSGNTDVSSSAVRLRADWNNALQLGTVSLTPWLSTSAIRTGVDAYVESGGGFPASFGKQSHTARDARLGVTADARLSESVSLSGTLEGVHRFDRHGPALNGAAIGLYGFSLPGAKTDRDCLRATLDLDVKLDKASLLSFSLHAANEGEDPNVSGSVSLRFGF